MKKIVVIEDEKGIRENLLILLESEGYEVFTACNGWDGLAKIRENKPDLIICDIMMPDIDGYEVLNFINSEKDNEIIPFIFVTAKVERGDMRKGMNLGADDYILKPYDADELLKAIRTRLDKYDIIKARFEEIKGNKIQYTLNDYLLFRIGDHSVSLKISSIMHIVAEKQYTSVFVENNKSYIVKRSLTSWEEILPKSNFIRIHRSILINMKYLDKIERIDDNCYRAVQKKSGKYFNISRRFYKNLKKLYR